MAAPDPTQARFDEIRDLIDANDRAIVAAVNERLRLVRELWALKAELELPIFDSDREQRLRDALAAANTGPLSQEGLDGLVAQLLALTRAELARD